LYKGLTKREYIAALMMPALCEDLRADDCAETAVKYADALLVELERK
jgi:hypothetical protein